MKSTPVKIAALLISLLFTAASSKADQWRGIVPLKSTRSDVERLFGKPTSVELDSLARYQFENEKVSIRYISDHDISQCEEFARLCHCGLPKDTVLAVNVESKVKFKFSSLSIDKTKFQKYEKIMESDDPYTVIYKNYEAGIVYFVSKMDDEIWFVKYIASTEACEEVRKRR
jgi:hypothetical protein